MAPRLPELFGDFLLLSRLARTHMAETLLAVRLGDRSGRTFVVKRPALGERRSGRAAQAIAREGDLLRAVSGTGIVALEAAGELAGLPYVALEHVRGVPLDVLLARSGALPEGAVSALARDLARALSTLHAAGYAHGDVAPSNVLVDDAGEAVLIDFGLAAPIGERRADVAGKPGYVAPEALRGVAAAAAEDVYGWGIVVAECLTGRRLFPERELTEAGARSEAPSAVAALGAWAERVGAALRRDPSARPAAADLARAELPEPDRGALAELVAAVGDREREPDLAAPPLDREGVGTDAGSASRPSAQTGSASRPSAQTGSASRPSAETGSASRPSAQTGSASRPSAETGSASRPSARIAQTVVERQASNPERDDRVAERPAGSEDDTSAALTPTVPMKVAPRGVARRDGGGRSAPASSPAPTLADAAASPAASPSRRGRLAALALSAAVAFVFGGVVGRWSGRARAGAVSVAGVLPRRTTLELDGRAFAPSVDGSPQIVAPGRHTLSVRFAKGDAREVPFQVRAGEQVVLVPILRTSGAEEKP